VKRGKSLGTISAVVLVGVVVGSASAVVAVGLGWSVGLTGVGVAASASGAVGGTGEDDCDESGDGALLEQAVETKTNPIARMIIRLNKLVWNFMQNLSVVNYDANSMS
jgi:hypothetical protein